MEYHDLTIDLRSLRGGKTFEATVAETPFRDTLRVRFKKPLEQDELDQLTAFFNRNEDQARVVSSVSSYKIGSQVFSKIFVDKLGKHLSRCCDFVSRNTDSGLRLRFRFQRSDPLTGYLTALPWEWLLDPETGEFLALDRGTPVVREIAAARPRGTLEVDPPLRILVVNAAPNTIHELNAGLEIARIRQALAPLISAGLVDLIPFERATSNKLRDLLLKEEIHVLHFIGHGRYDPDRASGEICFEKDDQSYDPVKGEMFATYLKRIPSLRLVVLNACETACHGERHHGLWSHGVASAVLERTGVPAVIASQYTISDSAAIEFSSSFYGRIAVGDAVDEAITETRLRLWGRTPEWATPILFLTAPNGKLFKIKPKRLQKLGVHKPAVRRRRLHPEKLELQLGIRSIGSLGASIPSRNQVSLNLLSYFKGRAIQRQAWWQEKVFPDLQDFLACRVLDGRPLSLDFAAHTSIVFAAGWLLEPKSGFDFRIIQRIDGREELNWQPRDGTEGDGPLWLAQPDIVLDSKAKDIAVAISVSRPNVAEHVQKFVNAKRLRIGRIVDATIAPLPGQLSVRGGAHSIALAHELIQRLQIRPPHERKGRVHFFCACPNALTFYLGQLASASIERAVLYEFAFGATDSFGRYQRSIVLPPPGEEKTPPPGW
jgi:hypothetical protein